MILDKHIARKMLLNDGFIAEVIESMAANKHVRIEDINVDDYGYVIHSLHNKDNKNYYITKSVTEHLELFDTKKCMDAEGWKIFKSIPNFKKTYILPEMDQQYAKYGGSSCVRVVKNDRFISFIHVSAKFLPPKDRTPTIDSNMYIVMLFVDMEENKLCEHFFSEDGRGLAPFLYSLLCFIELCDNQVIEVQPGQKHGTKKSGKIINTFPVPITIVTNTWNVMTIRSEGFPVRGHVALRWTGSNRAVPRMCYIAPFQKNGYIRRSGKELHESLPNG